MSTPTSTVGHPANPPASGVRAALRTRLVSRLTGLTPSQLQHWHETLLQEAHVRPGKRGTPRLYSWSDYQRLTAISLLLELHIPTARVRVAVSYLDGLREDWWVLPLSRFEACVTGQRGAGRIHVAVRQDAALLLADVAGQAALAGADETTKADAGSALLRMATDGPLSRLSRFKDAVTMRPGVNMGLPSILDRRLETSFVARLVRLSSVEEVGQLYDLPTTLVERALAFEEAA